jgi:hypothetical protein
VQTSFDFSIVIECIDCITPQIDRGYTFKSRLLLNRSLTQQSNKIGESLDQVADRIAAALEARGYSFEGG